MDDPAFSRYHPNRFTLGGVIAERVNTAKTRRKVNPIFSQSLSSSRIIGDAIDTVDLVQSMGAITAQVTGATW